MRGDINVAAEQSVIGGLMLDVTAWPRVCSVLRAADFCRRTHQLIFDSIDKLVAEGRDSDPITVAEYLDDHGQLEAAGGLTLIAQLCLETASTKHIATYADIVATCARTRRIKAAAAAVITADDIDAAVAELAKVAA